MLSGLHKWYDQVPNPPRTAIATLLIAFLLFGIFGCPFWIAIPCTTVLAIIVLSRIVYMKG